MCVEDDTRMGCRLSLVSKATHSWTVPMLYTTVTLHSTWQIDAFFQTLRNEDALATESGSENRPLSSTVRKLWIGPVTLNGSKGDFLTFKPRSTPWSGDLIRWPLTMTHQILMQCTSLQSLALITLNQNDWSFIESAIPASLKSLWMGPAHGAIVLKNFRRNPRISHFTSIDTFMRDDEVVDIVVSPHTRVFRRIFTSGAGQFARDQLACLTRATGLREMRLEYYYHDTPEARKRRDEVMRRAEGHLPIGTVDDRVKVVYKQIPQAIVYSMKIVGLYDLFYEEWIGEMLGK